MNTFMYVLLDIVAESCKFVKKFNKNVVLDYTFVYLMLLV
jgi:hypothetical protein